jgi:hypothetical protein
METSGSVLGARGALTGGLEFSFETGIRMNGVHLIYTILWLYEPYLLRSVEKYCTRAPNYSLRRYNTL